MIHGPLLISLLIADKKCYNSNVFIKKMLSHTLKCNKNTGIKNTKISKRNKGKQIPSSKSRVCDSKKWRLIEMEEASRDLGNLIKSAFLPLTLPFLIN